jgi:hypothetical protein
MKLHKYCRPQSRWRRYTAPGMQSSDAEGHPHSHSEWMKPHVRQKCPHISRDLLPWRCHKHCQLVLLLWHYWCGTTADPAAATVTPDILLKASYQWHKSVLLVTDLLAIHPLACSAGCGIQCTAAAAGVSRSHACWPESLRPAAPQQPDLHMPAGSNKQHGSQNTTSSVSLPPSSTISLCRLRQAMTYYTYQPLDAAIQCFLAVHPAIH